MRDYRGQYISQGWLDARERAYAHYGETPPPIIVDERGVAREETIYIMTADYHHEDWCPWPTGHEGDCWMADRRAKEDDASP